MPEISHSGEELEFAPRAGEKYTGSMSCSLRSLRLGRFQIYCTVTLWPPGYVLDGIENLVFAKRLARIEGWTVWACRNRHLSQEIWSILEEEVSEFIRFMKRNSVSGDIEFNARKLRVGFRVLADDCPMFRTVYRSDIQEIEEASRRFIARCVSRLRESRPHS